ncbi:polyketide synthase [Ornithinibacillus scapharcae]|uniref:polyketide synthase n=1 Tax=Ornithinibacillus scapharcae TaxID=1147159 RepID=UPI000225B03D|nr:polyketide synthase [Ornithinibacillus scapharcae]
MNSVVELREVKPGIALLTMQDRENKNTFTNEFLLGIKDAFEEVKHNTKFKVLVITGYDNYFASGGTKDALIAIQEGKANFDKISPGIPNIYSLPLDCEIPVVAAVQGHAIGGGLAFALFSDFIILSKESVYTANFMNFGFTPGFGSTYIFPAKLGITLAKDILISARKFRGEELRKRGIPFEVYPRKEVLGQALELAEIIAEKPRLSLITLKNQLVKEHRNAISEVIKQEVQMHDITFHQPEVKENIQKLYIDPRQA